MGVSFAPSLVDFLVGESLEAAPTLRCQVICHCLGTAKLAAESWVVVLDVLGRRAACVDVVLKITLKFQEDPEVAAWILSACSDVKVPLYTRLHLHANLYPGSPLSKTLASEASAAVLAGEPLPVEALGLLDVPELWSALLLTDKYMSAAALVNRVPSSCRENENLTNFLCRGLSHSKRIYRRACTDILAAVRGGTSAALLSLLSESQPLHIIDAVDAPPPEFHAIAVRLALQHSDFCVQSLVLKKLVLNNEVLFGPLADAALKHIGNRRRAPLWVSDWKMQAGTVVRAQGLAAIAPLLAKPFPPRSLAELLDAAGGPEMHIANSPTAGTLTNLKRQDPDLAACLAARFLAQVELAIASNVSDDTVSDTLIREALRCHPPGVNLSKRVTHWIATSCPRHELPELAPIAPCVVTQALLSADAATVLWAAYTLPGVVVVGSADYFCLHFPNCPAFGQTSWVDARVACVADPSLAVGYPPCDPEYQTIRATLLALGPSAVIHTTEADHALLCTWSEGSLTRHERVQWLHVTTRLLQGGASALATMVKATAITWAASSLKDSGLVRSILVALKAASGGAAAFDQVWATIRSCGGDVAREAAELLGTEPVPTMLLDKILGSSSLSAALATLQLECGRSDVPTLAALIVRAVVSGGAQLAEDHPAAQTCQMLPKLSPQIRADLFYQLLRVELPQLPTSEGSPKSEVHNRYMRLWGCVGCLVSTDSRFAVQAGDAVELYLCKVAVEETPLPPTRVLLQNVWARAAYADASVLQRLTTLLNDLSLHEAYASRCVVVAAQLILRPCCDADPLVATSTFLDSSQHWRPLLAALVGWSAAYSMGPRLLASLALYHALESGLLETPGWYLAALHHSVANGTVFKKLRASIQMNNHVSQLWTSLERPYTSRPLDVAVVAAMKHNSESYWVPPVQLSSALETHQRRPVAVGPDVGSDEVDVAVIGSFLSNLPNMAGLVRTTESLLGRRAEVALRSDKVLADPHFLKMSVGSEHAMHVVAVPEGPRLTAYIREKRATGFTIVALEQTSASTILCSSTILPRKLVVIVGDEQQGVPPWLVQSGMLDQFFELPLLGRTQSLNAHVATAMLLWHYRLQH